MRAAVYVRVSTVDQQYSPQAQVQAAACEGERRGYSVEAFDEPAISARFPFARRRVAQQLLGRLGEFDAVIFAKLDRAFRDTVDCILTVDELRRRGKEVIFLDLGVDTRTPAGQLFMEQMAAFAKFERARIAERTREALAVARQRGVRLGRRPGNVDGVALARAAELRGGGASYESIAASLEAEGFRTPAGGSSWSHTQAKRLIARAA